MFNIPLTATALKYSLLANIGLALVLVAGLGVQQLRVVSAKAETAKVSLELANVMTSIAQQREKFEADARKAEREAGEKVAQLRADFAKEMEDAKRDSDALVADLRAGNVRLRNHWLGLAATAELSAAAEAAARADGSADLRERGAADLIRLLREADNRIKGLQAYILAVNGTG